MGPSACSRSDADVIIATEVTVATGIQTCTVALRVVRGLEKETQCLGHPVPGWVTLIRGSGLPFWRES
jgi:hypothetical protein